MRTREIASFGSWVLIVGLVVGSAPMTLAQGAGMATMSGPHDAQIQADATKALNNKRFQSVKVSVHNSLVTLSGTVDLYSAKEDADKKMHHIHNVDGVQNNIQVGGPNVEDALLRQKLSEKLAYYRVGYGTTPFNALTLGVQNGLVTIGGTVYGPVDKDEALGEVENYPGVKDVIDNIEVAPVNMMDDQLRIALYRTIYGTPQLNKYAVNPEKPIRITVVNGNVTLSGVVDSQADKEVAGIRANSVPNVFKVTNDLQVIKGK